MRVPPTSGDEVGELTRAFNEMGESLQQKERISSAFGRYVSDYVLNQLLESPGRRDARRHRARGHDPVRRHPPLHAPLRGHEGERRRRAAERRVPARLRPHPRARRHDRQVHRRLGDGLLRRAGARPRPPAAGGARRDRDRGSARRARATRRQRRGARRDRHRHPHRHRRRRQHRLGPAHRLHRGRRRGERRRTGSRSSRAPREILVSEAVQRRVRGAVRLRFEGERQLSGRVEPVHVYSVDWSTAPRRPAATPEWRAVARIATALRRRRCSRPPARRRSSSASAATARAIRAARSRSGATSAGRRPRVPEAAPPHRRGRGGVPAARRPLREARASTTRAQGRLAESMLNYRLALELQPEDAATLAHVQELARDARERRSARRRRRCASTSTPSSSAPRAATSRRCARSTPSTRSSRRPRGRSRTRCAAEVEERIARGRRGFTSGDYAERAHGLRAGARARPGATSRRSGYLVLHRRNPRRRGAPHRRARGAVRRRGRGAAAARGDALVQASDVEIRAEGQHQNALAADARTIPTRRSARTCARSSRRRTMREAARHLAELRARARPEVPRLIETGRQQVSSRRISRARSTLWRRALLIDPGNQEARAVRRARRAAAPEPRAAALRAAGRGRAAVTVRARASLLAPRLALGVGRSRGLRLRPRLEARARVLRDAEAPERALLRERRPRAPGGAEGLRALCGRAARDAAAAGIRCSTGDVGGYVVERALRDRRALPARRRRRRTASRRRSSTAAPTSRRRLKRAGAPPTSATATPTTTACAPSTRAGHLGAQPSPLSASDDRAPRAAPRFRIYSQLSRARSRSPCDPSGDPTVAGYAIYAEPERERRPSCRSRSSTAASPRPGSTAASATCASSTTASRR